MNMWRAAFRSGAVTVWLVACSPTALALSLVPESNEELAAAPRIVLADLQSAESRWNSGHNLILTDYRFRTVEVFRGAFSSEFTLTQGGGTVGEETHELSDLPVFRSDARYLLILNENDNAVFSSVRYGPAGAIEVDKRSQQLSGMPQHSVSTADFRALVARTPVISDAQLVPPAPPQNLPFKVYSPGPVTPAAGTAVPAAGAPAAVPPGLPKEGGASAGQGADMDASEPVISPDYVVQGWPVAPVTFNPLPHEWVWHPADQNMMAEWNRYGDIFRVFTTPTGDWSFGNNRYDLAGFPSDADMIAQFGVGWGAGELAVCWSRLISGRIVESDIAMNPAFSWTLDEAFATDPSSAPYSFRDTMLHELGHSWGLKHPWEYQHVWWPSVMNYPPKWARNWKLHSDDTAAIRSVYPGISIDDGSLEMYRTYQGGGTPFNKAVYEHQFATDWQYFHGEFLEFTGPVTLQNLGTGNLVNPLVEIYLTENRRSWGNTVVWLGATQYSLTVAPFPDSLQLLNLGYHFVHPETPTGIYYPAIYLDPTDDPDQNLINNSSWAVEGFNIIVRNVTQTLVPTGNAQYTSPGNIGPSGQWQLRFLAMPGQSYLFSTCGLADFDTIITLTAGTEMVSNDDFCGLQSEILWHSQYQGFVDLYITGYNQAAQGSFQLMYKLFGDPEIETWPLDLNFFEEETLLAAPPTEAAAPDTAPGEAMQAALEDLILKAQQDGSVRVIVGFEDSFQPEGALADAAKQTQRLAIQDRASEIIAALSGFNARENQRYQFIPYIALTVDVQALQVLAGNPMVTSIEEDSLAEPSLASSNEVIGSEIAWAAGYDGTGQTVAVLDTGVDKTHPWFTTGGNKVVSEACYSTTAGTSTSLCPGGAASSTASNSGLNCAAGITGCEHGTHVAGIVAGNNGAGPEFGVARGANIIAVQVFSRFDDLNACDSPTPCVLSYVSDQIAGLERIYALRNDFNIAAVNMSLGGGQFDNQATCDSANPATKAAIDNLRSVNVATVIAAGNNTFRNSISSPGCISSAISVGATTDLDEVAGFSNMYQQLHLLAPGVSITSAVPGGGTGTWNGTSMATPHVAGAWAVLRQKTPQADVSDILYRLQVTGTAVDDLRPGGSVLGIPRIDLGEAITNQSLPFTIFNRGGEPLEIESILTNAPAPWISWDPQAPFTVIGGQSRTVRVSIDFDSAPDGYSQSRLLIESNDLDESPYPEGVYVSVTASSTPSAEFDSTPANGATLAFGDQPVLVESAALPIEVRNIGNLDLVLNCLLSGADSSSFHLIDCPALLAAGDSGLILVSCNPLTAGFKAATLEVSTNDPDEASITFSLTCTGLIPPMFKDNFEG